MNPNRSLIKGIVCGVRVEEIENPLMQNIRYLDKLIDELAKESDRENPTVVSSFPRLGIFLARRVCCLLQGRYPIRFTWVLWLTWFIPLKSE